MKLFVRADQMSPYTPEILESLLALETRRGQVEVSAARINAAVEAKPENVALVRLKAALALAQRDMAGAEANLKRAIGLDPTSIATYRQLATLYQVTGRLGESLEIYKRALEQEPESAHLHHLVAVLYEMGGRIDAAMEEYARAIELNDELGEAKNNLAYLLAESGNDLDRALDLAQSAKALMPDNPNAADTLGWALYKRGISSAAVGYLKEAVAGTDLDSPNLGVIRHHLAQAYEGNSQKDEAIESLEIALADLERRSSAARARGDDPVEPQWSVAARQMLKRLRPAG